MSATDSPTSITTTFATGSAPRLAPMVCRRAVMAARIAVAAWAAAACAAAPATIPGWGGPGRGLVTDIRSVFPSCQPYWVCRSPPALRWSGLFCRTVPRPGEQQDENAVNTDQQVTGSGVSIRAAPDGVRPGPQGPGDAARPDEIAQAGHHGRRDPRCRRPRRLPVDRRAQP